MNLETKVKNYENYLYQLGANCFDEEPDLMLRSLFQLTDMSVKCNQYDKVGEDLDYKIVERVCLVRVRLSVKEIKAMFDIEGVNVYGTGFFVALPGVLLSSSLRDQTKYDKSLLRNKVTFDLTPIPEEIRNGGYEFRLTIPAAGELFVPKKTRFTEWINSTKCIKYLDYSL